MPLITFIARDGTRSQVKAVAGQSLMESAKRAGVDDVRAECGGACACATCHVHIAPDWQARLRPPTCQELEMLEIAENRDKLSRLSCQIIVTEQMDGLVATVGENG